MDNMKMGGGSHPATKATASTTGHPATKISAVSSPPRTATRDQVQSPVNKGKGMLGNRAPSSRR